MRVICILVSLVLVNFKAAGLELSTLKRFPVSNPLSYQSVRAIAQDDQGFMWFGTQEGLHRFDGYEFVGFHHDDGDASSLSADTIGALLFDSQQRLWVGTRGGGLNLMASSHQGFVQFMAANAEQSYQQDNVILSDNNVNAILEDSAGNIWVATENGLTVLSYNGHWLSKTIYQQLGNPDSLANNSIQSIIETKNREIWVGTNGGISVFDLAGNFLFHAIKEQGDRDKAKLVTSILEDRNGDIWFGTQNQGVGVIRHQNNQVDWYQSNSDDKSSLTSNIIQSVYQDSSQQLWVASDQGIALYRPQSDDFQPVRSIANNPYSLSNDLVLTFFEDDDQMMWIGTFSGVNRWDPNMMTFTQYNAQKYPILSNTIITAFAQHDDERLFFSTYSGGVYQLSIADEIISKFNSQLALDSLRIMTLLVDDKYLWVGTRSKGLYRVEIASGAYKHFQHDPMDPRSLSANSITDILKDQYGILWVSTYHKGLNRLDGDQRFTRFTEQSPLSENGPSSDHVLHMVSGDNGDIWLATYGGGINRFDSKTGKFTHIIHDVNDPSSLSSDLAWILHRDNTGNLWVGTQSAGLNRLDVENIAVRDYKFQHFDLAQGLRSRTIYGISEDANNHIWLSSNKGISRLENSGFTFKHFDTSHGLRDLEYNHSAVLTSLDQTLYFGSAKGFTSVHPSNITNDSQAPKVHLTGVSRLNEPMFDNHRLTAIKSIAVGYDDPLIAFDFVGLNYRDPESTNYQYRLVGFDDQWVTAGKVRRATYTNLPAGSYQFQVKAGNSDNVWSEPAINLRVNVAPAPWKTWWAYLIYTMAIMLALLAYARMVSRKLHFEQQQRLELKRQVEEQTKEFKRQNEALAAANTQLERAATTDKLTGVKSRRYLDIYIEQASQLMMQLHQNLQPVQRQLLPRLYLMIVRLTADNNNSRLTDVAELLMYCCENDEVIVRWSEDTFMIVGYQQQQSAHVLANKITAQYGQVFAQQKPLALVFSYYPFTIEQPVLFSWDQISSIIEHVMKLKLTAQHTGWLGIGQPKQLELSYLDIVKCKNIDDLQQLVNLQTTS